MDRRFIDILDRSEYAVFFGGAGVSTASGIPDFRSATGIFTEGGMGYPPEVIVSHDFFYYYPEEFYDFYKKKMLFPFALPNQAHKKLAELESQGKIRAIITQNIDGLHQKAGSEKVLELHGNAHRNFCTECGKKFDMDYILRSDGAPYCDECGGLIKPDVVLYGENLDYRTLVRSAEEVERADLLIVGGTSLNVTPASSFVDTYHGKDLVIINKTPTHGDCRATLILRDGIEEVFDF